MNDDGELQAELTTLLSSSSIVFGGDFLSKIIRFVAFVVVTRALSVPDFGSLSLALVVFQIASTLALLGQNNALQHFFPTQSSTGKKRDIARKSLVVTLGASFIAMVVVAASAGQIARLFGTPELVPILYVAAVTLPVTAQFRAGISITRAFEMTKPRIYLDNLLFPVSRLGFVAVAAILGLGVVGMMSAYFASYAVVAIAALTIVYRQFRTVSAEPSGVSTTELLSFSAPLLVVGLLNMITGQIDKFLLGLLATNYEVGVFNVVFTLAQHLLITLGALSFIFTPMFSRLASDVNQSELSGFYRRVARWGFYSTMGVTMVVIVFAEPILAHLFKPAYATAADTLRVLSFGYLVVAFFGLNDNALLSMGFSQVHMYGALLTIVTNTGLDLLLIPRYGVFGAAVGTAGALLFTEIYFSLLLYRHVGIHVLTKAMLIPGLIGIGVPLIAAYAQVLDAGFLPRTVFLVTWLAAFGLAVLFSNGIDERDRNIIRSALVQTWKRIG